MVNIVSFSIFQYLPNDMRACPFIHVWKYCQHPFLDADTQEGLLSALMNVHRLGPAYGPLWFNRPWSPHR
jgi:hypothetical protein